MATLDTLVQTAIDSPRTEARAGSGGAWRVSSLSLASGGYLIHVWHYSHLMAAFVVGFSPTMGEGFTIDYSHGVYLSTGWGSVSDAQGMNRILYSVCAPYVFRRDYRGGGPRYETLDDSAVLPIVRDRFGFPFAIEEGEAFRLSGIVAETVA